MKSAKDVLEFWLGDSHATTVPPQSKMWFEKSDATDERIRSLFLPTLEMAIQGECDSWTDTPEGTLALIILLDQFSRNLFRNSPRSFAQDSKALALARKMVDTGADETLGPVARTFVYLPFEHSESLADQQVSVERFSSLAANAPDSLDEFLGVTIRYAQKHSEIIERFGRFPHRNAILGRTSTPEEVAFLKTPGSSF